jgi:2-oxo-4-hydroxy-4-carboxy-5-ureidoimidazoline decarboxylase
LKALHSERHLDTRRTEQMKERFTFEQINSFSREEFIRAFGSVFEHSPWIAQAGWEKRPFTSVEQLHDSLCSIVKSSSDEQKLALIRAHPDLVGRAALAGTLTRESTGEQASAGLNNLSPEEIALFQKQNAAYREKFGFPFIICARLNKKDAIIAGFERRLKNSREEEIKTALGEIFKIVHFRLSDLIHK